MKAFKLQRDDGIECQLRDVRRFRKPFQRSADQPLQRHEQVVARFVGDDAAQQNCLYARVNNLEARRAGDVLVGHQPVLEEVDLAVVQVAVTDQALHDSHQGTIRTLQIVFESCALACEKVYASLQHSTTEWWRLASLRTRETSTSQSRTNHLSPRRE